MAELRAVTAPQGIFSESCSRRSRWLSRSSKTTPLFCLSTTCCLRGVRARSEGDRPGRGVGGEGETGMKRCPHDKLDASGVAHSSGCDGLSRGDSEAAGGEANLRGEISGGCSCARGVFSSSASTDLIMEGSSDLRRLSMAEPRYTSAAFLAALASASR